MSEISPHNCSLVVGLQILRFLKKGKSSSGALVIPQHIEFLIEAIAG
jgi:hypothetical protein